MHHLVVEAAHVWLLEAGCIEDVEALPGQPLFESSSGSGFPPRQTGGHRRPYSCASKASGRQGLTGTPSLLREHVRDLLATRHAQPVDLVQLCRKEAKVGLLSHVLRLPHLGRHHSHAVLPRHLGYLFSTRHRAYAESSDGGELPLLILLQSK